jgi:hypothetical protein
VGREVELLKVHSKISHLLTVLGTCIVYGDSPGTGGYEEINIKVHKNRQLKRVDKVFQAACGKSLFDNDVDAEDDINDSE